MSTVPNALSAAQQSGGKYPNAIITTQRSANGGFSMKEPVSMKRTAHITYSGPCGAGMSRMTGFDALITRTDPQTAGFMYAGE